MARCHAVATNSNALWLAQLAAGNRPALRSPRVCLTASGCIFAWSAPESPKGVRQNSSERRNDLRRCPPIFPSPLNGERARVRGGAVRDRLRRHIYFLSRFPLKSHTRRILSHTPVNPGRRPPPPPAVF